MRPPRKRKIGGSNPPQGSIKLINYEAVTNYMPRPKYTDRVRTLATYLDSQISSHMKSSEFESIRGGALEEGQARTLSLVRDKLYELFPEMTKPRGYKTTVEFDNERLKKRNLAIDEL